MKKLKCVVISDIHLGTFGSHAQEVAEYLNKIEVEILVLNGDIIDMWQFKKKYFPSSHWNAIKAILAKIMDGTQVYYLTGNHDDHLRKLGEMKFKDFHILDKLILSINNEKYWFFHGDVFDNSVNCSQWLAKLGGKAYDILIRINRSINIIRGKFDLPPVSFSKKIKANVKKAVKYIDDFEDTAVNIALKNNYDYVVCGHIHKAKINTISKDGNQVTYMNSGDWVESLTSLEYIDGKWEIYDYLDHEASQKRNASQRLSITRAS